MAVGAGTGVAAWASGVARTARSASRVALTLATTVASTSAVGAGGDPEHPAAISTVTIKTKTQRMTNSEPVKGRLQAGRYRGKRTVGFEENGEPNWIHRKRDCDREEGI